MIRYAAAHGYDKVAWTTGEQQVKRYRKSLANAADTLTVEPWRDGYKLQATKGGRTVTGSDLGIGVEKGQLSDYIGKEMASEAEKRIAAGETSVTFKSDGEGFKVGGHGMRAFYDKILPIVANDVLKKLGGGKADFISVARNAFTDEEVRQINDAYGRGTMEDVERIKEDEARVHGTTRLHHHRQNALFSRTLGASKTLSERDANALTASLRREFSNVEAIPLPSEQEAPKDLRADIKRQGAEGTVAAAYWKGKVYIFLNRIASPEHFVRAFFHESTHLGLAGVLGTSKDEVMMNLWRGNEQVQAAAQKIIDKHGLDTVTAVEEALAEMGEQGMPAGVMDRLIAWVRQRLRALGVPMKISDTEVRALVSRALDFAKRGKPAVEMTGPAMMARGLLRAFGLPRSADHPIATFTGDVEQMKAHPDYRAAKAGNLDAAARVVQDLVRHEDIAQAKQRFGSDVIYVGVHAQEATGESALPIALATYYADRAGGSIDQEIIQSNRPHHTGAKPMERLISPVEFDGAVKPGARYVLSTMS